MNWQIQPRTKPLVLNALFLLAFAGLVVTGVLIGRGGDTNGCLRLFLLALLLIGIGTVANLVMAVALFGKHQARTAIVYLLGFVALLAVFALLRTIIIRVVAFDLPTALVKALITGKLPDGNPVP